MAKVDLIATYALEAAKLRILTETYPRSTSGTVSWASTSSGITYSTATYDSGKYADQGEEGLLLILLDVLKNTNCTAAEWNALATLAGIETLDNKTLTSPKVLTAIFDANGNEVIKTPATTSAVNEITVTNAATGNAPAISATGGDTNINLNLAAKGTGIVTVGGSEVKTAANTVTVTGSSTFNSDTGRVITHSLGHQLYRVFITLTANPSGYLGEMWVIKADNTITVYCSGTYTGAFDYEIITF